jgi:hypothetical protein
MLAEQIVLGLPHVKTREDAAALWGVLERNGGLAQGNLRFRLADVACEEQKGNRVKKVLLPFLDEVGAFKDEEFVYHLMKISLTRGTEAITRKLLEYPAVQKEVLGDRSAEYLSMPLLSLSPDNRKKSVDVLLGSLDFSQQAKDEALAKTVCSSVDKSSHDRLHEVFACLIDAGANPTVPDLEETKGLSTAFFLATRASSFHPKGAEFLEALMRSAHWKSVLETSAPHGAGFAWNWFNSGGDGEALLKGLEVASPTWWECDRFNVFAAALLEAQAGESIVFNAIKTQVKKKAPSLSIGMDRAVTMAEDAIRIACEECCEKKKASQYSILDQLFESLAPDPAVAIDRLTSFWSSKAPMIAVVFEDPKAWRLLCQRTHDLLASGQKTFSDEQVDAFIDAQRLDLITGPIPKTPSPFSRRL